MASHKMQFAEETDAQAVFECSECHRRIGFAKPETGRVPAAVKDGDIWQLPENGAAIVAQTLGEKCDA